MKIHFLTRLTIAALLVSAASFTSLAQTPGGEGWSQIFNGKDLTGWKVNEENPDSVRVEDGMLVVDGPRTHVFYDGPVENHEFKNFEFKAKVKTTEGSNSGIYFHTEYQAEGWPSVGYEAQVNNSHSDWRRTGSLYAISDNREIPAKDGEWFDYYIKVEGKHIIIKINDQTIVDYTEPESPSHLENMPGRKLDSGTFAFQAHDPDSVVYYKDIYVKPLP